jgi:hypothetical protein
MVAMPPENVQNGAPPLSFRDNPRTPGRRDRMPRRGRAVETRCLSITRLRRALDTLDR